MLQFTNGGNLVQSLDELPKIIGTERIYVDFETTSGNPKITSLNPHHNCHIAGICVATEKDAWYIPIDHRDKHWNLSYDPVIQWLSDLLTGCKEWVNHNIKYDAHVATNNGVKWDCRLVCTMTLAKIIDSDRYRYALSALSRDWLNEDVSKYENRLTVFLKNCKSKDYGDVPADIMGEYGCQDVITTRRLYHHIIRRMPEQCRKVMETEILLTPVLYDIEQEGMCVNPQELQIKELQILTRCIEIEEEILQLTNIAIRPHTNADCFDLLCNNFGLPVLGYTENNNPSFDKETLKKYSRHPDVLDDESKTEVLALILEHRQLHILSAFFVKPYQELNIDGVMHPSYNQAVRTTRLSCKKPNAQQLSHEAKLLVHPPKNHWILSFDYSQIEFRLIVHFIKNPAAIAAYAKNPDQDFHQWVADMAGVPRNSAKNINFAMGFGGGKDKILSMLESDMTLVGNLMNQVKEFIKDGKCSLSQRSDVFKILCRKRAEQVFMNYHKTLPELKHTTYLASMNLKSRGFVFNLYGRHRHLPANAAFRSFNAVIQSSAADLMKERTVALAPRYNKWTRENGIKIFALVHDETALHVPEDIVRDPNVYATIIDILESPAASLRVPIRVDVSASKSSWGDTEDVPCKWTRI